MQAIPSSIKTARVLSITAHPDDMEMHHSGLLLQSKSAWAMIATEGEGSTLNFNNTPAEELARTRRNESKRAMAHFGFQGIWLDLPDGRLMREDNLQKLTAKIIDTSLENEVNTLVSMGEDGYCGHEDHIATHLATLSAQRTLAEEYGRMVSVYALDPEGPISVRVERERKLAGFAFHASQIPTIDGRVDEVFWRNHRADTYDPLTKQETYREIRPATYSRRALRSLARI